MIELKINETEQGLLSDGLLHLLNDLNASRSLLPIDEALQAALDRKAEEIRNLNDKICLANNEEDICVFEVGKIYSTSDWYTGGTLKYKYEGNGVFSVEDFESDGLHHREETFQILKEERGEYIILGEYSGHEHVLASF